MMNLEEISKKISEASALELELVWIPKIMRNQTGEEIEKLATVTDNRIGLNGVDAPYVTIMYNRVKSGSHLSDKQADVLRRILPKYKRQYARMMNNGKEEIQLREV